MLELRNISSGYGKKQVLFDLSFEVGEKRIVMLTGSNGSGKSSVLKCIFGILPLWDKRGKIQFDDKDLTRISVSNMVREGIVFIPQKINYFESLTIQDNLAIGGSIYPKSIAKQRLQEVYKLPYLFEYRNRTPFHLSGGERQMLALGIGLMHNPKLLLFDEPFAGLDETNTKIMVDELLKLKNKNVSILMVEHQHPQVSFIDQTYRLYLGKLIEN